MDFLNAAEILVPSLSGIPVTICDKNSETPEQFEKSYCFSPNRQVLYTADGLHKFFKKRSGAFIYMVEEPLDTRLLIFKIRNIWVLLGPYIESPWDEKSARSLLAEAGIPDSALLPYKSYHCMLPIAKDGDVIRTATLLLEYTTGNTPPHELAQIYVGAEEENSAPLISENYGDANVINRRYELENKFMEAIRMGKTKTAITLFREMEEYLPGLRFISDNMKDRISGAAVVRTIARKGAEQAGLTPIAIDAISQEFAQKMHHTVQRDVMDQLTEQFISRLCYAVRQENGQNYTVYIRKAMQYIDRNLSAAVSIADLSKVIGLNRAYLTRMFAKETGMTIKQYIARKRCETAAEMLRDSNLNVNEISSFVGYADNNYFTKVFKSVMGSAPMDYRKHNRIS